MTKRPSWESLKSEYVAGSLSYKKLADKHGIPFSTLRDQARMGGWYNARKTYRDKVVKKTLQKIAVKQAQHSAKQIQLLQDTADELVACINKAMKDKNQLQRQIVREQEKSVMPDGTSCSKTQMVEREFESINYVGLEKMANTLKSITESIRNLYHIPTMQEKAAMDMAEEKLKLEQHKAAFGVEEDENTGVIVLPQVLEEVVPDDDTGAVSES